MAISAENNFVSHMQQTGQHMSGRFEQTGVQPGLELEKWVSNLRECPELRISVRN
jgi:hypothetical protein